jgi:hypothetical protein
MTSPLIKPFPTNLCVNDARKVETNESLVFYSDNPILNGMYNYYLSSAQTA